MILAFEVADADLLIIVELFVIIVLMLVGRR